MRAINTNLVGVIDETSVRGQAMAALIHQYLGLQTYYPFRPVGDDQTIEYPCVMVDPRNQNPELANMGEYHVKLDYSLRWYVLDNNPTDCGLLCSYIGESLVKLFSNNALNDLATAAPPSHKFCDYDPFWTDVTMMPWQQSPLFPNVINGRSEKYMRVGRMQIQIETWVIK